MLTDNVFIYCVPKNQAYSSLSVLYCCKYNCNLGGEVSHPIVLNIADS